MSDVGKDVAALRDSSVIAKAQLASSPYVLRKVFAADPLLLRIIAAGDAALPHIAAALGDAESLDDISLAALAYVVESIRPAAAPRLLGPVFERSVDRPGPFFVHLAAHAVRRGLGMRVNLPEPVYTRSELAETRAMLH